MHNVCVKKRQVPSVAMVWWRVGRSVTVAGRMSALTIAATHRQRRGALAHPVPAAQLQCAGERHSAACMSAFCKVSDVTLTLLKKKYINTINSPQYAILYADHVVSECSVSPNVQPE